ncbi:MAG: arylsulfatase [Verrucomicrobiota bacterium]
MNFTTFFFFLVCSINVVAVSKPNILLILTDDQGYGDFSINGNTLVETPVLDKFAREGIQFERFFVSPVCAPTRASLLTGRWWLRSGVWGVTQSKENMRPSEITIAETLQAAGYRTGCFGKWHNGEQFPYTAPGQGFDEFLGFNNGHWNNYFDAELIRGSHFVKTKGFISDVLTDEAISFIEKNKAQPFFCYVPFNAPHSPFQVSDKYFNKYKTKGLDDVLASVYGMCENTDDNVGRLLATLDRLKLRENTIVFFLTDNGANTERFNAGMRGRKGSVHEGGTRVPLWMQWPAQLREPRVIKEIAAHIDLYPTLLELCGIQSTAGIKFDGVSLVPLLKGQSSNWPERILFTHQSGGREQKPERKNRDGVRTQRYRAVFESGANKNKGADEDWQLYDMQEDPGEKTNIAKSKPDMVKQLAAAYEAWFTDVAKDGFAKPRIPVGYDEQNPVRLYAPQSSFSGNIRFFAGSGFANDWLTGWTKIADKIFFELEVGRAGLFDVELAYACPKENTGSKIRVSAGTNTVEGIVKTARAERIPLPHRDGGSDTYINRDWGKLKLGQLRLDKGPVTLSIEALSKPGEQVMDLKHVQLTRVKQ